MKGRYDISDAPNERALVLVIVDGKKRYLNHRINREAGETPDAFAARVAAATVKILHGGDGS